MVHPKLKIKIELEGIKFKYIEIMIFDAHYKSNIRFKKNWVSQFYLTRLWKKATLGYSTTSFLLSLWYSTNDIGIFYKKMIIFVLCMQVSQYYIIGWDLRKPLQFFWSQIKIFLKRNIRCWSWIMIFLKRNIRHWDWMKVFLKINNILKLN